MLRDCIQTQVENMSQLRNKHVRIFEHKFLFVGEKPLEEATGMETDLWASPRQL